MFKDHQQGQHMNQLKLTIWLLSGIFSFSAFASDWFPVSVAADGKAQQYQPLVKAHTLWRICALLPHGKDHYWWGVAWGLSEEASRLGVMLGIYEAGVMISLISKGCNSSNAARRKLTPISSRRSPPMVCAKNCNNWRKQVSRSSI